MFTSTVKAQVDPHFSQYYAYPLWLNPAMTGVVDGDYRLSANYRNQWSNFGDPYATTAISFDMPTGKNIGLGVTALNLGAGSAGFKYLNGMASVSYLGIKMGKNGTTRLVPGIQFGFINRRVDPSKFQMGSQYNPVSGFDPNIPTGELLQSNGSTVLDANVGLLLFDGNPNHKWNPFVGVSAGHLTQPVDPFMSSATQTHKLPIRFTAHAGSKISISDVLSLTPHALFLRQGNAQEIALGAYAQMKASLEFDFLFGFNYRVDDAVTPFAGFHYKNVTLGLSYDGNVSSLKQMTRGNNAFEISISLVGRKKRVMGPEHFICPRL
jgi:type IX secretion system PorP/SprF family membrane protein